MRRKGEHRRQGPAFVHYKVLFSCPFDDDTRASLARERIANTTNGNGSNAQSISVTDWSSQVIVSVVAPSSTAGAKSELPAHSPPSSG
jgi:hypothetical protein